MTAKAVRDTVGMVAVIASLVFVGLEIRQATRQARANTRQALVDDSFQLILARAADPELNREVLAWRNAKEEDALDCEVAHARACMWVTALLRHHENIFVQVREGVVDESVYESYGWTNNRAYTSPFFEEWWRERRQSYDVGFRDAFEAEYGLRP